jgi:hypothetical protein
LIIGLSSQMSWARRGSGRLMTRTAESRVDLESM